MIIKSFSTDQFAGISDRQVSFTDGMNVVLGDNESGKSTVILAMYYALNKSVKIDGRSDKDFLATVFPTSGEDTVDTTVCVQTPEDEYKIKKVWDRTGEDYTVNFKPQSSGLLRGAQAEKSLKELLEYGPAVYSNLIFGRQSNEAEILEWCYSFFSSKSSKDVEEAKKKITEAFSAVGGISPDKFIEMLNLVINGDSKKKVKGLIGNWDYDRDTPARDARGNVKAWKNGNGSIIDAFYAYEEAQEQLKKAASIEEQIADKTKRISELLNDKSKHESDRDILASQHGAIAARGNIERLLHNAETARDAAARAIKKWPADEETLKRLKELQNTQEEKSNRTCKKTILDLIADVQRIQENNSDIQAKIDKYPDIASDYDTAKSANTRVNTIRGMLTSSKLRATIAMEAGFKTIVTLADGSIKEIEASESFDADGFVKLNIPGVASIQVAPQELDVDGLQTEEVAKLQEMDGILTKYNVSSLAELEIKVEKIKKKASEIKDNEKDIKRLLSAKAVEDYEVEADAITADDTVVVPDSLEEDIKEILGQVGKNSLGLAIGSLEKTVEDYEGTYKTQAQLSDKHQEFVDQADDYTKQLQGYSHGPQMTESEYTSQIGEIKKQISAIDKEIGEIRTEIGTLFAYEVTDISGLENFAEEKKQEWIHEKKKYEYYLRIKADFDELHSETGDKFSEFYDKFNEYLALITGERISLKLDSAGLYLQSKSNGVNSKELLSEGTKKTVLLAFRLAVLEYFFPNGGGFVVLDDDLLDMDPDRRDQAAKLLNNFAESNQVIFTTCDPAIADLLGGNLIQI